MAGLRRQAEKAATAIGACLEPSTGVNDPNRLYAILKRWYWHAYVRAPNTSQKDMDKVRGDLKTLYQREEPPPPSPPLATHVEPVQVNGNIPSEAEMEALVLRLRTHRAGRHTHLHEEHFKQWQREVYPWEYSKNPPQIEGWI